MSFTHSKVRAAFAMAALGLAAAGCETATLPQAAGGAVSWNLSGAMDEGAVEEGTAEDAWTEEGWTEVESSTTVDTVAVSASDSVEYLALAYDTGESEMIRADASGPTVSGGTRGGSVTFPDGLKVSWVYARYSIYPETGPDGTVYWHVVITYRDGSVHHYIWSVGRFRHFTKSAQQTTLSGTAAN